MKKPLPSQEYLQQCFEYNSEHGTLRWRIRPRDHFATYRSFKCWNGRHAGRYVSTTSKEKYLHVKISAEKYATHRVVWKLITGKEVLDIDHKNNKGLDFRWDNLREASGPENAFNAKRRTDNKTGFKGVSKRGDNGKFMSYVNANGIRHHLGTFSTAEEAFSARTAKARELHGEFWNPG